MRNLILLGSSTGKEQKTTWRLHQVEALDSLITASGANMQDRFKILRARV